MGHIRVQSLYWDANPSCVLVLTLLGCNRWGLHPACSTILHTCICQVADSLLILTVVRFTIAVTRVLSLSCSGKFQSVLKLYKTHSISHKTRQAIRKVQGNIDTEQYQTNDCSVQCTRAEVYVSINIH